MKIRKFNEAKEEKPNPIKDDILKILRTTPKIKLGDEEYNNYPDEHKLYSVAGLCAKLGDKYTTLKIDQALNDLKTKDKEVDIKVIGAKNYEYDDKTAYYYLTDVVDEDEVKEIKKEYEDWSKEASEDAIDRRKARKTRRDKDTKKVGTRKATQKQLDALEKAREARKKKKGEKTDESILTFSEMFLNEKECSEKDDKKDKKKRYKKEMSTSESKLENELEKGDDGSKTTTLPKSNGLPVSKKIKGISTFLEDIDKKVLTTIKDKGVTVSTYKISDTVGIDVKDVHNVLEKLESEEKVKRYKIGTKDFWSIK